MEYCRLFLALYLPFFLSTVSSASNYKQNFGIPKEEIRIILIGKSGVGKSSTGNSILGRNVFHSKSSSKSVTNETTFQTNWRFGRKLVVVDTPGLADNNLSENEVLAEITKTFALTSPGPNVFILLVRPGRFLQADEDVLLRYQNFFGEDFNKYLIVLFTDKHHIEEREGSTIDEYVKTFDEESKMTKLLREIENRYTIIDYSKNLDRQTEDVIKLLGMIDKMMNKNNPPYFRTMYSDLTEEIYHKLIEIQSKLRDAKEDNKKANRSYLAEKRDNARKELLDSFLGVTVRAFLETYAGKSEKFSYYIFKVIYKLFL